MNYDFAMKWADALESGNYKQGRGALRRNNRFCCLGVACDLIEKTEPYTRWILKGNVYEYAGVTSYLPLEVKDAIGMRRHGESQLIVLNDGKEEDYDDYNDTSIPAIQPKSFPEIAKFIRENWETL